MDVRAANESDIGRLRELWLAFAREVPAPDYLEVDADHELREVEEYVRDHVALIADGDGSVGGFVLARMRGPRHGWISDLYVVPDARRSGLAAALVREAATRLRAQGADAVSLEVQVDNADARVVYERWGFREALLTLSAPLEDLEDRLSRDTPEPSYGLVFVQSDDESQVGKAATSFLPRLGGSARTDIHSPANGWIAIDDELCSGDPALLRRLAQELSYRTGGVVLTLGLEEGAVVRYVLFDRGSVADEYASLPEYHGPLPSGDVVALSANPTVAHRLTGADPEQVRLVARTAGSPAELPTPRELYSEIAAVLGVPLP